jgi:nucleoside-diphosphate-sugar epimerase
MPGREAGGGGAPAPLVLVTGAGGFVGSALSAHLAAAGGVRVRAASRRPLGATPGGPHEPVVADDLADPDLMVGVTHVAHLAARAHRPGERGEGSLPLYRETNVVLARRVAEAAARAGVERFVLFSTAGVLGDRGPPGGGPLGDASPPAPSTPYAASKLEGEEAVRSALAGSRTGLVVLRPTLVYGRVAVGNLLRLARLVRSGVPLPLGAVRNRRSLVSLERLCELARLALFGAVPPGGATLLAADSRPLATPDIVRAVAAGLGRPARLPAVPPAVARLAFKAAGRPHLAAQLLDDLEVTPSAAALALGWRPCPDTGAALSAAAAGWRT